MCGCVLAVECTWELELRFFHLLCMAVLPLCLSVSVSLWLWSCQKRRASKAPQDQLINSCEGDARRSLLFRTVDAVLAVSEGPELRWLLLWSTQVPARGVAVVGGLGLAQGFAVECGWIGVHLL